MFAPVAGRAGRTLHLFDRWGDLPGPTAEDGEVGAAFDRDHVQRAREDLRASNPRAAAARLLVDELGLHPDRVVFHQGWFEKTFPAYDGGPIAFAHVDADWYESMSLAFDFLDQHLAEQATVVVDDLGDWPGVAIALAEFRESIGSVDLEVLNGQGVVKVRRDRVP